MDIYLLIDGKQEGPYTEDQVRHSLAEGLIPNDLPAWHEGLDNWVLAESLISPLPPPPFKPHPVLGSFRGISRNRLLRQVYGYLIEASCIGILLLVWWHFYGHGLWFTHPSPKAAIIEAVKLDEKYEHAYAAGHEVQTDDTDAETDQDAQETAYLAQELEQIDLSGCPDDFKAAFTSRINAIREIATVLSQHPHFMSNGEAVLSGMAYGLVGAVDQQSQYQSWTDNLRECQNVKTQTGKDLDGILDRYGITSQDLHN